MDLFDTKEEAMNSNRIYKSGFGSTFEFNDHVCIEMLIGVADEKRTGRLVQVRKGVGQFMTDMAIIRLRDGGLATFENVLIRHARDKAFENAFYRWNGKEPPLIPDQPPHEDDALDSEYTIQGEWHEVGFVIEHPKQPPSATQSFSMMITSKQ